jgi:hypothetical protein
MPSAEAAGALVHGADRSHLPALSSRLANTTRTVSGSPRKDMTMGTRSLTIFVEDGKEIAVLYRQYDGDPIGHGAELKAFLQDMHLVNGISLHEHRKIANGMGCLAAQVIAHFKEGAGNFYLHAPGTRDIWEEYRYFVGDGPDGTVLLKCEDVYRNKVLYDGPIAGFRPEQGA